MQSINNQCEESTIWRSSLNKRAEVQKIRSRNERQFNLKLERVAHMNRKWKKNEGGGERKIENQQFYFMKQRHIFLEMKN